MNTFDLTTEKREQLLHLVTQQLEVFYANTKDLNVSSDWDPKEIKAYVQELALEKENPPQVVINQVIEGLSKYAVHTPHPNYFGLFNPRPSFVSILGDLITATFNPQLAAWSHSPFANEIENHVIQEFGRKFGYESPQIDGTFCTGGAESNLTAVITALNFHFPDFNEKGILGMGSLPIIYCSSESHHSIVKAAKMTGLGINAVKSIAVNKNLQMDFNELKKQLEIDRQAGQKPFMIVGTAGTTGAGTIDDLNALHQIASQEDIWFHVDAAYGGAIAVSEKHRTHLSGINLSDSITLDLHKWFSVPMGASLFLTRKNNILHQSFSVKTKYMPEDGNQIEIVDPYIHSVQWSRRFIGLKMYLPLAVHGWKGYEKTINNQIEMGDIFRHLLKERGWEIKNTTRLPVVCFTHKDFKSDNNIVSKLVNEIVNSGKAWLSVYPIDGENTIRVCMTNYSTTTKELKELIDLLEEIKHAMP